MISRATAFTRRAQHANPLDAARQLQVFFFNHRDIELMIFSMRMGRLRTRFPVAWQTAFAMAAWIPAVPSMPIPLIPPGNAGRSSSIIAISKSGMSAWTGMR